VFGRIVGPCGAVVAVLVGAGVGVGVLPGDVGPLVGVLPGPGVAVGALDDPGAPGFCGAVVPGVDEPPPPPHAVSATTTMKIASALARRNAAFSNVWPLVQSAYGVTLLGRTSIWVMLVVTFVSGACIDR
jgi:hypothetical protein